MQMPETTAGASSGSGAVWAEDLQVDGRRVALGVPVGRPLLSWCPRSARRGAAQAAWQVRVVVDPPLPAGEDPSPRAGSRPTGGTASEGPGGAPARSETAVGGLLAGEVVWDSGQVASADSVDVVYGGPPLLAATSYLWQVRVWDEQGEVGAWSEPGRFETALAEDADWCAAWITGPDEDVLATRLPLDSVEPLRSIARIWLPGATRVRFRVRFRVPPGRAVIAAPLVLGGAVIHQLWVDGRRVDLPATSADSPPPAGQGEGPGGSGRPGDAAGTDGRHGAGVTVDLARYLRRHEQAGPSRDNLLAVAAEAWAGLPGGLLGRLEVLSEGSPALTSVTDPSWSASAGGAEGWQDPDLDDTDLDDSDWAPAVEVGLHGDPPWGREPASYRPSPYLQKRFILEAPVRRARLYSSALGVYHLSLNAAPVSEDRLSPGWTDYHQRIAYRCDDVTDRLVTGENRLVAVLGDGWYASNIASFGPFQYGSVRALCCRLEVDLADGRRVVVVSDASWQAAEGPIRYADLQNGEVQDGRMGHPEIGPPEEESSRWRPVLCVPPPRGRLEPEAAPPIRVHHELAPVGITARPDGSSLVDFGQNLVGWVALDVVAGKGDRVVVRHAEALSSDGGLYLDNLRSARQSDEYLCSGGPTHLEPLFSVHGFRYAEVVGLSVPLDAGAVLARVAYADMEQTGDFSCSDRRLGQLQSNIVWGQRGNFLSVPTDCPQRDERLGWTGDAQVFARTAAFNYDTRRFFRKWLTDVADAQRASGGISFVAPHVINRDDSLLSEEQRSSAGWGDAVVMVPAEMLRAFADRRSVEQTWDAARRWIAWLEEHSTAGLRPASGFGDWLSLGVETPRELVATAFCVRAVELAAELAAELGHSEHASAYRRRHGAMRAAFRRAFVRGGRVSSGTQAALVLALEFGLLDPDERPVAVEALVEDIRSRNGHLSTGFLATPFLLGVLADGGRLDVAYELLLQESYPSWLYPIAHGATTMWERWDTWTEHGGFQDPHMNSLNHYAYGAVGAFLYEVVGGLSPLEAGYRRFRVWPRPGGGITWARTSYRSVRGPIEVAWRLDDSDRFELDVEVPPASSAQVWLPADPGRELLEGREPIERVRGIHVLAHHDHDATLGHHVVLGVGGGSYRFVSAPG